MHPLRCALSRLRRDFGRAALVLIAAPSSCGSCTRGGEPDRRAAAAATAASVTVLPQTRPWSFHAARDQGSFALPAECGTRAPHLRADVAASARFAVEPTSLATLAIAEVTDDRVTAATALGLNEAGAASGATAIPWPEQGRRPLLGRTGDGRWIQAIGVSESPGEGAPRRDSSVVLWRGPASPGDMPQAESVGEGDRFDVSDLACAGTRCAMLTARLGTVAAPGAEVRIGEARSPVSTWRRMEIGPTTEDGSAQPFRMASAAPRAIAVVYEGKEAVFWDVDDTPPREVARLSAPYGVLDATVSTSPLAEDGARLAPALALVHRGETGDDGCARGASGLRIERSRGAPTEIASPEAAVTGSIRPLQKGAIATWMAPLGCAAERKVVFAVILSADGAPTSDVVAVADATAYGVATTGNDVDLWIQRHDQLTWIRATCAPP